MSIGATARVLFLAGAGCAIFLGEINELEGEMRPARPARAPAVNPGAEQPPSMFFQPVSDLAKPVSDLAKPATICRARRLGELSILTRAAQDAMPHSRPQRRASARQRETCMPARTTSATAGKARRVPQAAAAGEQPAAAKQPAAAQKQTAHSADGALRLTVNLPVHLSPDQQAVHRLLARGLNNAQIATRLQRKRRWVCYRVAELKQLLGVQARSDLRAPSVRGVV